MANILLYPNTKSFMQQIRILIFRFFYVPYPLLFVNSIFREVGAGKGLQRPSTLTSVNVDNNSIKDSSEMANEFNNFFLLILQQS